MLVILKGGGCLRKYFHRWDPDIHDKVQEWLETMLMHGDADIAIYARTALDYLASGKSTFKDFLKKAEYLGTCFGYTCPVEYLALNRECISLCRFAMKCIDIFQLGMLT